MKMEKNQRYRDFDITFVNPPIPIRTVDFFWCHKDYDEGDSRYGFEATLEACKVAIYEWYNEVEL